MVKWLNTSSCNLDNRRFEFCSVLQDWSFMQVNFDFKDINGEHSYCYDYNSVPRVGDHVRIQGEEYIVNRVTWNNGLATCKLE